MAYKEVRLKMSYDSYERAKEVAKSLDVTVAKMAKQALMVEVTRIEMMVKASNMVDMVQQLKDSEEEDLELPDDFPLT